METPKYFLQMNQINRTIIANDHISSPIYSIYFMHKIKNGILMNEQKQTLF